MRKAFVPRDDCAPYVWYVGVGNLLTNLFGVLLVLLSITWGPPNTKSPFWARIDFYHGRFCRINIVRGHAFVYMPRHRNPPIPITTYPIWVHMLGCVSVSTLRNVWKSGVLLLKGRDKHGMTIQYALATLISATDMAVRSTLLEVHLHLRYIYRQRTSERGIRDL